MKGIIYFALVFISIIVIIFVIGGIFDGRPVSNTNAAGGEKIIKITDTKISARSVKIKSGGRIIFQNAGQKTREIILDAKKSDETACAGLGTAGQILAERSYSNTFHGEGVCYFYDRLDPEIKGKIVIQ